jgi:hypothetical protein
MFSLDEASDSAAPWMSIKCYNITLSNADIGKPRDLNHGVLYRFTRGGMGQG